ncbi:polyprenyl synthetase family protein [bacterium]|nr:polyprenyl synthetase family protein [bacterium]
MSVQATATLERAPQERYAHAIEIAGPILERVEERIDTVLASLGERVRPVVAHLVGGGGKRVRPLLVALAGEAFGARADDLAELGAAAELVHTATLLHDDVVDQGSERRGKATANVVFGNGPPVLSGDFLYAHVFQRLLALGHLDALHALADAVKAMVSGELLQLERRGDASVTASDAVAIAERKTASLFAFAAGAGARAGGASGRSLAAVATFGKRLGLAFQVADDILDFEEGTGKEPRKDLLEGTITLPVLLARERDPSLRRLLRALLATKPVERGPVAREIAIRTSRSGGLKRADSFARALALGARSALLEGAPPGPARAALLDLNEALLARRR